MLAVLCAPAAHAAFPGANGKIAYECDTGLCLNDLDGTNEETLDPNAADPAWSHDGARIAFTRAVGSPATARDIWVMDADGSNQVNLTNHPAGSGIFDRHPSWGPSKFVFERNNPGSVSDGIYVMNADGSATAPLVTGTVAANPSWSPDGSRIAFNDSDRLQVIDADGTDHRELWGGTDTCGGGSGGGPPGYTPRDSDPDWSPDGSRLAYIQFIDCDGDWLYDVRSIRLADSAGRWLATNGLDAYEPAWSPDGTKVAYHLSSGELDWTASDGTGRGGVIKPGWPSSEGHDPSWQPLPSAAVASFVRPRGASPFRVPLVPAAKPCTTPNREHGPPLAFGSCAPVAPESPNITVSQGDARLRSVGSLRVDVETGAPGPPDDQDVRLNFSLTNVLKASDFSDYTGELRARLQTRITDRQLGVASTTVDLPYEYTIACAATADPAVGGSCVMNTTFDSVVPGSGYEGARGVWEFDRFRVFDGGPDGDAETAADNSLFATQGVFVP
jgi:dipeptidyl aminopeptidase/acylaminoacyl peptidase